MENIIALKDTVATLHQVLELKTPGSQESIFQLFYYGAMVTIALANIILVIYIFTKNNKKDESKDERNRKINLLKTLILDYKMEIFYSFFHQIKEESKMLLTKELSDEEKTQINGKINDLGIEFRQDFTDIFIAIDVVLYQRILSKSDKLIDNLTENIFDEGVNLSHQPKFNELIIKPINESKTDIIKILFSYSG